MAHSKRIWRAFFCSIALVIIVTLIAPNWFGLQGFIQWGGMYVNRTCAAELQLGDSSNAPSRIIRMSAPIARNLWYSPMFNQESCIRWVEAHFCKDKLRDTLRAESVVRVTPVLAGRPLVLEGDRQLCREESGQEWFIHVPPNN